MKPATKISDAWAALGAEPKYPRSWSAWAKDRQTLFVTLPDPDILPDGCTIPLWDRAWKNTVGNVTATSEEQVRNVRAALDTGVPILGFRVEQTDKEKITAAHYGRLLLVHVTISPDRCRLIGRTDEPIKAEM